MNCGGQLAWEIEKNIGNKGRTLCEGERYSTTVNNLLYERFAFCKQMVEIVDINPKKKNLKEMEDTLD